MRKRKFGQGLVWGALACALSVLVAMQVGARTAQGVAAAQTAASAGEVTLSLEPAKSNLHWSMGSTLHTVHGKFALKSGTLKFDPVGGSASGEFVVFANSGETGNDSRDKKMHTEILESAKFPEVVFRPTRIDGRVAMQGASDVQLEGKFALHGAEHDLTVPVHAELTGDRWKGTAKFNVPYVQWGLKSPNTFLLKADPTVEVELELNGTVQKSGTS